MGDALGQLQLQVMKVVWRLGQATVADVHEQLDAVRKIAYTTVLTTLRALERRGLVCHETAGKAYLYRPIVSREQYARQSVRRLVDDLFGGQRERLLCHLLGAEKIGRDELDQIRWIVRRAEREGKGR